MASPWNISPQDLFIGSLYLLLHVSTASALILKRSCLYGPFTRITGSFADYCTFVMQSCKKNFVVEESYYAKEVFLVLYQCFVKEMVPKCGCLVDFFATSWQAMRTNMQVYPYSLLKIQIKTTCLLIALYRKDVNRLIKSNKAQ